MSVSKTKKYVFAGLCLTLLSFLLLTLSGCDATSDPRPSYQATGSWQGTIGADRVWGIIAPDRTYHLAIVDAGGNFVGEYVGTIHSIGTENIGSMTMTRLHATEAAGATQSITFKLSADRLYSLQGIELSRTVEANGPAVQSAVAGHWSLDATDNLTDVVVNADGTLSGSDGVNCNYSGSLQLLTPSWNIFSLDITLSDIPGGTCNDSPYSGLAMLLPPENARRRLWLATNNRPGIKTFFGEWAETVNVAPVAQMTILGERADQSVLVKAGAAVALDAQGSSDANNDALTYVWSGTDPLGGALTITVAPGTGSAATFTPTLDGLYSLTLSVSDGITTTPLIRPLRVEWTLARFINCNNGTVLDSRTNLLWLQDAGCVALNQGVIWGVSHAEALLRVGTLADGVCDLGDTSAPGEWHLPTLNDFSYIVPQQQWIEGAETLFLNVGTNPDPLGAPLPYYWTADPDPATEFNWFFVDVSAAPVEWFGSYFGNTSTAVWPMRALRSGETCP